MKPCARISLPAVLLSAAAALCQPATAATAPMRAADHSGVYDCTGLDSQEGPYTATVTLERQAEHSTGAHAAYRFQMEVPGYGTYLGHAVSAGRHLAIHFALSDPSTRDFGTGLATVSRRGGKTVFEKFYYEPEFKGGNHGTETCVRR